MANYSIAYKYLLLDKFSNKARGINKLIATQSRNINYLNNSLKKSRTTFLATSAVIMGTLTGSAIAAGKYQSKMANVFTLLDEETLGKFSGELNQVALNAIKMGFSIDDVTKALFDTISAGVEAGKAGKFFTQTLKLAVGGVTDLGVSVDGLTSVMNAYGAENFKVNKTANTFFTAQKFGKTTVSELAQSVGLILPVSKAAGLSFAETASALATLTLSGLRTNDATTALRNVIQGLISPSADAAKALRQLKIPVGATELKSKGLGFALQQVNKAYKENRDVLTRLFPNIRGFLGAAGLSEKALRKYDKILKAVNTDTTSLTNAFEIQQATLSRAYKQFSGRLKVFMITIGTDFLPALTAMFAGLGKIMNMFIDMNPTVRRLMVGIGLLTAGFTALLAVIGTFLISKDVLIASLVVLRASFVATWLAASGPIGLIVLGVAAVTTAIVILYKKFAFVKKIVDATWASIRRITGLDFALKLINLIGGKGHKATTGLAGFTETTRYVTEFSGGGRFRADINLNVPRETLKSVKTKADKKSFMDLGFNLREAY